MKADFSQKRIYYNNFASHLLNAYNPNMLYPELKNRWSDDDWFRMMDMLADFGFNVFEFWLEPKLFCREGLTSDFGREFIRQMSNVIDYAHAKNLEVEMLCALATSGADWRTLCPNVDEEWKEIQYLWDQWTRILPVDIVGIFPGDPGACSRNGCTAETYIDKSIEASWIAKRNLPKAWIEFGTWGSPFWGWGLIEGPPDWKGEFISKYQHTAWRFDKKRADDSMNHLVKRLPDFPAETSVAINMGFNGDGNPVGELDSRHWAKEIAKTNPILTWDFSLTEGEAAIAPHYRFDRLFEKRKMELDAAPYKGGICQTITPLLNQLSLFEGAQSFLDPNGDHKKIAGDFFEKLFGLKGRILANYMPFFEIVPDWGNYARIDISRSDYHKKMREFVEILENLRSQINDNAIFHPSPKKYHAELLFFANLFADLSSQNPDYSELWKIYWNNVYSIYDDLPNHVDPRPKGATDRFIERFMEFK